MIRLRMIGCLMVFPVLNGCMTREAWEPTDKPENVQWYQRQVVPPAWRKLGLSERDHQQLGVSFGGEIMPISKERPQ